MKNSMTDMALLGAAEWKLTTTTTLGDDYGLDYSELRSAEELSVADINEFTIGVSWIERMASGSIRFLHIHILGMEDCGDNGRGPQMEPTGSMTTRRYRLHFEGEAEGHTIGEDERAAFADAKTVSLSSVSTGGMMGDVDAVVGTAALLDKLTADLRASDIEIGRHPYGFGLRIEECDMHDLARMLAPLGWSVR